MHVSRSTFEHPDATLLQEPMVLAQKSHQIESCLKFLELQDIALQESKKRLPAIFTCDMSVKKESIPSPDAATLIILQYITGVSCEYSTKARIVNYFYTSIKLTAKKTFEYSKLHPFD